jgi:uncharacterized protein
MNARATVERLIDRVGDGEWDRLAELYAEDAVVEQPFAQPNPVTIRGREALATYFAAAARAGIRFAVTDLRVLETDDPEVVVAEYRYRRPTGEGDGLWNVQVFRVRDGDIVESRDYHDHARLGGLIRNQSPAGRSAD